MLVPDDADVWYQHAFQLSQQEQARQSPQASPRAWTESVLRSLGHAVAIRPIDAASWGARAVTLTFAACRQWRRNELLTPRTPHMSKPHCPGKRLDGRSPVDELARRPHAVWPCTHAQGRDEEAAHDYRHSLQLQPSDSTAMVNFGLLLSQQKRQARSDV